MKIPPPIVFALPIMLRLGSAMVKTIRKIERYTGLYNDEHQVDDAGIKAHGSLGKIQI